MPPTPPTPEDPDAGVRIAGELLARVAGGDRAALADLYDRFAGPLFSIVVSITRDRAAAEDVVQVAMTKVWQRAASYKPALGKPTTWIITIARNTALDHIRSAKRRTKTLESAAEEGATLPPSTSAPESRAENNETADIIRGAIAGLPPQQAESVTLAFLHGMSQTEIATHLEVPLGTVKSRIRRAMHTLRVDIANKLGIDT